MSCSVWGAALRLLIIVAIASLAATSAPLLADEENDYVPGEVVVKLVQAADLANVAATYQLDPTPLDQFGSRPIYRLRILDGMDPQVKAEALASDPRVRYAEPNFLEDTPEGRQRISWAKGGGAGEYAEQWAAAKIRLPEAHTITRGAGVTVAVLDTGIDPSHPAFGGRLVAGYDFVNMDNDPREEGAYGQTMAYGHGTHVAGLIALAAPDARIMPIRVLDPEGTGNLWVLAEALAYAVNPDGDLNTDDGAHVINLSLSTRRPTNLLEDILGDITCSDDDDDDDGDDGVDVDDNDDDDDDDDDDDEGSCLTPNNRGAVVVAAAGNSASSTPEYPAAEAMAGLLAVAATTDADQLASFSNYGPWVQVAAPGERMISPVPDAMYGVWSGTSMATPLVAGQAALVRAVNPDWDAAAVANQIVSTSADIGGAVPRRIDAASALGVAGSNGIAGSNEQVILLLPVIFTH